MKARIAGLVLAATVLVAGGSAASAHYSGTLTVAGNAGGSSTVVGVGDVSPCPGYPAGDARATANGGSVTVTVAPTPPSPDCVPNTNPPLYKIPSGQHQVMFFNGDVFRKKGAVWDRLGGRNSAIGCHDDGFGVVVIGLIDVDVNGNGTGTYALPGGLTINGRNLASSVCVWGTEAPVTIVAG